MSVSGLGFLGLGGLGCCGLEGGLVFQDPRKR